MDSSFLQRNNILINEAPKLTGQIADFITIKRIATLHPKVRPAMTGAIMEANALLAGKAEIRLVQALRTFEEQQVIYNQGRDGKPGSKVSNAKPGYSFHQYGLAGDFCLHLPNGSISWDMTADFNKDVHPDWLQVVDIFKKHGFKWGGDFRTFKDFPHVEMSFGLTIEQCLALYNSGQKDAAGYIIIK